jgi:acyltransferase-like protein
LTALTAAVPRRNPSRPADAGQIRERRLEALDGLRGLAAFGVLLHVWMFSYGDIGKPPKGFADLAIGELRLGVQLFFVLSGFLIYRPFVGAALDGHLVSAFRLEAAFRVEATGILDVARQPYSHGAAPPAGKKERPKSGAL